ncbi:MULTISPECIES: Ppx/GppA phosphatase family protein [Rhodomicrobium]|uniref:Ppx/GppA phosphatase family protein n=1 Tax=Rhodomicrobium TaxID=1068 RepID=UPI001FDA232D|nr:MULTISPECIES: Ppx/GppA phosphatase family protein [Rhodomicrobium]
MVNHTSAAERAALVYGALDLGTNNCRLLVARPSRRGFQVIDAFSRIIRLGEGVSQTGQLSEAAMERTVEALKICSEKMHRRNVRRSRLIATEACRAAQNGPQFVRRVLDETGLQLEVIGRETEARLAVAGCASLIDRNCDWALVFDIGGGSTELIWLDLGRLGKGNRQAFGDRAKVHTAIAAWTSLQVGVVTLAEKFGGRIVDHCIFEAMVEEVVEKFTPFETEYALARDIAKGNAHLLGTSGTVTTIAGVHLALPAYSRSKVDGCWLSDREIRKVSGQLLGLSYEARSLQPCIGPERADLVLAGCAILEAIMRLWPCRRLRVADRGLREGILTSLMAEDARNSGNGWPR